jgi:fructose-1,6-bisphosphatase/inositol monophosphatase family enzyme
LLASGKIEAVINNRNDIYDYAAGKLIAKEAGAVVTDFKGKKEDDEQNSQFLASNCRKVHDQLLGIL